MAHTKAQKDKIRKSGLSLQNKTQDLGRYCDVFSALVYWNPTHERSSRQVKAVNFEAHLGANDDANADGDMDVDADAEYESDPECIVAVPAAAAEPLSVYDIIPDEDGGTVILHSPGDRWA
ncbi:uncharacterized protein PG986_014338 [Apiospora aurea]|uniref:Uncharacterized protein n=1 Tax=Apiospora aurea TaxID=335848 RepID=A0ABR1PSP8_9PEZI